MTGLKQLLAALAILAGFAAPALAGSGALAASPAVRLAQAESPLVVPEPPPAPETPPLAAPGPVSPPGQVTEPEAGQPAAGEDEGTSPDELNLGEIPIIETMELTFDISQRALDSYLLVRDKYANSDLEQYENLQDFVDQTPDGKSFETDVKAAGFANVNDWNLAITTLGVIYASVADDQTPDLLLQIKEVEDDTELAQDLKDRMIAALKAMIPSETNKKVVEQLLADADYGPKLKQLDIVEE